MLTRSRSLISLGRALAAVVIVAAAIGGYLYLEREAARQDVEEIERQLALAEGDLKALQLEKAKISRDRREHSCPSPVLTHST